MVRITRFLTNNTRLQADYFVSITLGCIEPLGMESGVIPDAQITASSVKSNSESPARARLNDSGWTAAFDNHKSWLQIDLGSYKIVTRLATRGSSQSLTRSWVISYKLQYSDDGSMFHFYQEPRDTSAKVYPDFFVCVQKMNLFRIRISKSIFLISFSFNGQVFSGNKDAVSVRYNKLIQPITTHFIRILPQLWHNHITMRVEIYGCQGTYVDLNENVSRNTSRHQF